MKKKFGGGFGLPPKSIQDLGIFLEWVDHSWNRLVSPVYQKTFIIASLFIIGMQHQNEKKNLSKVVKFT